MIHNRKYKGRIKEALDNLPNGICFFNSEGMIVLCNHIMYELAFSLTGHDLQHQSELELALVRLPEDSTAVQDGNQYLLPDGRAWQFSKTKVTDQYRNVYTQMIAVDITELYRRKKELEENNRKLVEYGKRIRRLSANINAITREEEILNTKMRVHDDIGRSIIAARQWLLSGHPTDAFDITIWKNALCLLKNDSEKGKDQGAFEQLIEAAAGIGIKILKDGEFPEDSAAAYLMITAMRECATNAVRHAGATELYAKVESSADAAVITITNNGAVPLTTIMEGGGLTSLRTRTEKAGGSMTVKSHPAFVLTVSLPIERI